MNFKLRCTQVSTAIGLSLLMSLPVDAKTGSQEAANTAVIERAFDNWKQGKGNFFDLLAEDAEWTVAGGSPVSGTYRNRDTFMKEAVLPINARFKGPLDPDVKSIVAQGDNVVVLWDGVTDGIDGQRYENSYAWHMQMKDGQITQVIAFLDTWRLVELMK